MTIAFVHGNPETDAVWSALVGELSDRGVEGSVLLSPPGFGAPIPDGWGATREEYRDWLVAAVEDLAADGPIDLVAHDWGAGHVFGLLEVRPDLVRSWACDCVGLLHPDYTWHDNAQLWQTPQVGEQAMEMMVSLSTDDRVAVLVSIGMDEVAATSSSEATGEMVQCILPLYRSAIQPICAELGARLAASNLPAGLAIHATADAYVGYAVETAATLGVAVATIAGAGHWWMCERPAEAAEILASFWHSLTD